jgi:acyl carrier protein
MIPSAFVELEALPMTASGKVDRRALPAPERSTEVQRAPRTPQEQILSEIFADVLSRERVGIDDNFFELGGHSLLAIRVAMRVRNILHIEIPVTALFEHPTISTFSRHIDEAIARTSATVRPPRRSPAISPCRFRSLRSASGKMSAMARLRTTSI